MSDESFTLLPFAAPEASRSRSNNSIQIKLGIAALAAVSVILIAIIGKPTPVTNDNAAAPTVTDLRYGFGGYPNYYRTGDNANDPNIIYLDRHSMNCGDQAMRQFHLVGGLHYDYQCLPSLYSRVAAYGYNTGWQEAGGVIYLDRQHVWCPDNFLLSSVSGAATNWWGWKFTYNFVCSAYDFNARTCYDYYTNWNDPGNSIIYLDRHDVSCPQGWALKGFEGQTGSCGWWCTVFRYHYQCCYANGADPTPYPIASPTNQPVANPTQIPTLAPIANPTKLPIANPTAAPIADPTFSPTNAPIAKPTQLPTLAPVANPTLIPTLAPTDSPVSDPTLQPISSPTLAPVAEPTQAPTDAPVAHPTQEPTLEPTGSPVVVPVPTLEPIAHPTQSPSFEPTKLPVASPTKEPTFEPTTKPTDAPVADLTQEPTLSPTPKPSNEPTHEPTFAPSDKPTDKPSMEPSQEPTFTPTFKPSLEPSTEPSFQPSPVPTLEPSVAPTDSPVSDPTVEPTVAPTREPSAEPTLTPNVPPAPADMSEADQKTFIDNIVTPEDEVLNPPSEPTVVQAPVDPNAAIPESPVESIVDKKKEEAADAAADAAADVDGTTDSPAAPVVSGDDSTKFCSFTFTHDTAGPHLVPTGCLLVADRNIDELNAGESSNAAYVCSTSKEDVQIGVEKLTSLGLVDASGASQVSYLKPGSKTSATWFNTPDFTGSKYTYTSGYHPPLTNVHMHGVTPSTSESFGNDDVKSIIFKSSATVDQITLPEQCS